MSEKLSILVVEDDEALRDALQVTLDTAGHDHRRRRRRAGRTRSTAPQVLQHGGVRPAHESDGRTDLLGEIRSRHPGLPVLLMTAFGDVDKAVAAMRGGACDFMLKPFEPKALIQQIERYATPPAPAAGVVADRCQDPRHAAAGLARGADRRHGAADRRIRGRQGSFRALHP
jgi:two-component system response regulator FlrC